MNTNSAVMKRAAGRSCASLMRPTTTTTVRLRPVLLICIYLFIYLFYHINRANPLGVEKAP